MLEHRMADEFRRDFEAATQILSETKPFDIAPLQKAMAEYFFQFEPQVTNLYIKLATMISNSEWTGRIATLNYDRLLALSLISQGIQPFCYPGNPSTQASIELCLPHGCSYMFSPLIRTNNSAGTLAFLGLQVRFASGQPETILDPSMFRHRIKSDDIPPVMSYFEPLKRTTTGGDFIRTQRQRFSEIIEGAEKVAVVGIQVRQRDEHIWEPLKQTNAEILYCSGKDSGEEYKKWSSLARPAKKNKVLGGYFREEFDEILSFIGLQKFESRKEP